ncbi:MAG: ATP-dependent RNA helicase [Alyxoria varia]|nr:MAG: ATP-dependent RNA helicase [Alyxoria varia]
MDSLAGKKRPSLSRSTKVRKKPKLVTTKTSASTPKGRHATPRVSVRRVKPDELKWTGIVPSYRSVNEEEGFAGLEEVAGVNILRDETTGQISLQASADSIAVNDSSGAKLEQSATHKDEASRPRAKHPSSGSWNKKEDEQFAARKVDGETASDDEWTGFEDDFSRQVSGETSGEMEAQDNPFALLEEDLEHDVDLSAWSSLDLSDEAMEGLSKLKFAKPTPIQKAAIPSIRDGRDVIGKAPTGSGKTLAFGVPVLESFLDMKNGAQRQQARPVNKSPVALIILPTRELASQIEDHIRALSAKTSFEGPKIATLIGNMSIQKQRRILEDADIVVATPGRLYGILSESDEAVERIQKVQFLVIDEADRLLKDGKFEELTQVLHFLEQKIANTESDEEADRTDGKDHRQTLVFSATFSRDLQHKLAKNSWRSMAKSSSTEASMTNLLKKLKFRDECPLFIDVNPTAQMAPLLHETFLECPDGMDKDLYLYGLLLMSGTTQRTLVFVNSISAVRRLVDFLGNLNIPALSLQSHMVQKARLRSIERFTAASTSSGLPVDKSNGHKRSAQPTILVATDVAARGLDLPEVALIVHYNLPRTSDTYIHRSGRTARASKKGTSVLLCAPQEVAGMRRLVAQIHAKDAIAQRKSNQGEEDGAKNKKKQPLQAVVLDAKILSRLKSRAKLAKQIADAELAREKGNARDAWMQNAAHDLGAELTQSEEDGSGDEAANGSRGSGKKKKQQTRKEREDEARAMTKAQLRVTRAQLRDLLSHRVNTGVSERYLAGSGRVDMHKLLEEREKGVNGLWLGGVPGLGLETTS